MKLNTRLFAHMRAATRSLLRRPALDTSKVMEEALKNAAVMTEAAQQHLRGMAQANGAAHARSTAEVPDMLAELSRNLRHATDAGDDVSSLPGSFTAGHFRNAAGSRDYKLYVPGSYDGSASALVVMLHGCTQDPDDFAAGTQMNALAEELGCLVVYPAQSRLANPQRCWNWFSEMDQQREQGEPSIIAGITRSIMADYAINPAQVYVAGLSAGGAMATIMGTLYPDLYAAVGVHSGLAFGAAHDLPSALAAMQGQLQRQMQRAQAPGQAIPIIVFHGDQDHTVHPSNADELMATTRDGAAAMAIEPGRVPDGHAFTRTTHQHADGTVQGEHWLIHGAGHAWSGGNARGSYTDDKGPDASREMMRFFSTHG